MSHAVIVTETSQHGRLGRGGGSISIVNDVMEVAFVERRSFESCIKVLCFCTAAICLPQSDDTMAERAHTVIVVNARPDHA